MNKLKKYEIFYKYRAMVSHHIMSTAFNSPVLDIGLSLEERFGLLYHSGQMGWCRLCFKFFYSVCSVVVSPSFPINRSVTTRTMGCRIIDSI